MDLNQFRAARNAAVPLIAIKTPDPAATVAEVKREYEDDPVVQWDVVNGVVPVNEAGAESAAQMGAEATAQNPWAIFANADNLSEDGILFVHFANRWINDPESGPAICQQIWNLRDQYKSHGKTLVLLSPQFDLPIELNSDFLLIDEPMPTRGQLQAIVEQSLKDIKVEADEETVTRAVDAVRGLPAFLAEQSLALSLTKSGIKLDSLWERKRQMIEQTPGLQVYRGKEEFENIGGCENVKQYMNRLINARTRPNLIVFIDEIEKVGGLAAGGGQDGHAVDKDQLGTLLRDMQDHDAKGVIFLGVPGAAKTAVAKATTNEAGIPMVMLDLAGLKGQFVGQSEANLRNALKVISSMSDNRTLWIATCNQIEALPKELRRRFKRGTFFFDLPDSAERESIWKLYETKYGISGKRPKDEGWTGAEIEQCCETAWDHDTTLEEASEYVVPVSVSAREDIDRLRKSADRKFISASYKGVYRVDKKDTKSNGRKRRVKV